MKASFYLRLALSILVMGILAWLVSWQSFYTSILVPLAFATALVAKFLMLVRTRMVWRELAFGAGITLILVWTTARLWHRPVTWVVIVSLVGMVGLALLILRVIWWEGQDRRIAIFTLIPSLFFLASGWTGPALLNWTGRAHPNVLDLYLLSFDASLRIQPAFIVGQAFDRYPLFGVVGVLVYVGLPIILGLTYAGCLMRDRKSALPAFLAIVLAGPIGVVFYNLYPAVGPVHLMPDMFPWKTMPIDQIKRLFLQALPSGGYRNAMPSLHAAWVYLAFWYSRRLSIAERALAGFFLIFTLIATLGIGEHYLIDLIVAVPFTVFLLSVTNALAYRDYKTFLLPGVIGLLLTLAWLLALRFFVPTFWISPVIPWTACVATIVAALWAGRTLLDDQSQSTVEAVGSPEVQEARVG